MKAWTQRFVYAALCVGGLAFISITFDALSRPDQHISQGSGQLLRSQYWEDLSPEGNLITSLYEKLSDVPPSADVPPSFIREVFDPFDFSAASAYAGPGVVGVVFEGTDVSTAIEDQLKAKAWVRVGTSDASTSYIKETGCLRWLYVQTIHMTNATTMVFSFKEEEV